MSHTLTSTPLTTSAAWSELTTLAAQATPDYRAWFREDPQRAQHWSFSLADLHVDLSKTPLRPELRDALIALATERGLSDSIDAMFAGEQINGSEGRSVLHTALRSPRGEVREAAGTRIDEDVHQVLDAFLRCADQVRDGELAGATGQRFTDVVNIGIGGSDLGPAMAYQALKPFASTEVNCHFVSNVDATDIDAVLAGLNPATTLIIITSKTFTTQETMANAAIAKQWLVSGLAPLDQHTVIAAHCVAVSTAIDKVSAFGIDPQRTFGFWEWVGGRYSVTSAVGISLAIALGSAQFREFLDGFYRVDTHFRTTAWEHNVPVLMGLLNIWYVNFCHYPTHAVLPYSHLLGAFPRYLQQLTMESNGKSTTRQGEPTTVATGEVFWGEPGTNGQHAFYQLIHQGTQVIPCDFIAFARPSKARRPHTLASHDLLLANCLAQSAALAFGRTEQELRDLNTPEHLVATKTFPGGRPSATLVAPELTPSVLGQLIALYEHITFVQGIIWDINSFDQWGVELGKELAQHTAAALRDGSSSSDPSTAELATYLRTHKGTASR